ncbi:unnamed protein product (macronuclear) [Paramecium tetraurelia]|uniref:Uncharacterized protein n=1 Tax=Paramecium tetraurelia TaxID=5888 RepID=A0DTG3_PARTE|nr:uncharacterized protein GSPATT00020011001 [Paramecium tetraurelia]CAK86330.1 unnamed protein product [Paramecium tetraurelia]|eukprot:XP_001453727.1 hypothetical protein (macronuclear) [Paramecium tetraurelia strain d4-2]
MQDKQIIQLFEKYSKLNDPKLVFQTSEQILERVKEDDITFVLSKIMNCLQSTEYDTTINYALLLKQLIQKYSSKQQKLQPKAIFDQLQQTLSKKNSYGKSEFKHFMLTKYFVYSYLDFQNLLNIILEDRKTEDSEYLTYVLLKHLKPENVKQVSNSIKNDLQNLTPRVFCILVKLQQLSQKGQFQWDKYLQEQIFDRQKFHKLLQQANDLFPKKQLFYQYLAIYMGKFSQSSENSKIFAEFWEYLFQQEDLRKLNYIILSVFKYFLKSTSVPLSLMRNQQLVELWYRQFGNSNSVMKRLANKIEQYLTQREITFEDIVYLRNIYGYRIHPKNGIAQKILAKFTEEEIDQYFENMKQQEQSSTDPINKLYYLNEIYVLATVGNTNIKVLTSMIKYIYEIGCQNFEQIYEQLDEESKEAYQFEEIKKKFLDQCQSFFYSLVGKVAANVQEFDELTKSLLKQLKKSELIKQYKLITGKQPKECIKHLVNSILMFSLLNQEEGLQILEEFQHIAGDIQDEEPQIKKKVKTNPEKAKVVLTEVFIQLLTKSPQFLRDAVNQCCKSLEFTTECLEILLDRCNNKSQMSEEGGDESLEEEEEENQ